MSNEKMDVVIVVIVLSALSALAADSRPNYSQLLIAHWQRYALTSIKARTLI
jgi:hypothetical protein